jgi:hypothetical protein
MFMGLEDLLLDEPSLRMASFSGIRRRVDAADRCRLNVTDE